MGSTALNQAHKRAREALNATNCVWKVSGVRMDYKGTLVLPNGLILRSAGKSELNTMEQLRREYDAAAADAIAQLKP